MNNIIPEKGNNRRNAQVWGAKGFLFLFISLVSVSYAILIFFARVSGDGFLPIVVSAVLTAISLFFLAISLKRFRNKTLLVAIYLIILVLACVYGNYLVNHPRWV